MATEAEAKSSDVAIDTLTIMAKMKKTISFAVENLKIVTAQDVNLSQWLDLLQLKTKIVSHIGPSAFATMKNGYPVVQIDMMFIMRCHQIAELAGLVMAGPSGNTMYTIGKNYGRELQKSIFEDAAPPPIKINLDSLILQPGQDVAAKAFRHIALGAAIQFVILHEIGHHQLKHFNRQPRNLAESREWELAADTWAIKKMLNIGYSLDPLSVIMFSFQLEEEIRKNLGLTQPIEYSSHPSWSQRRGNLERFNIKNPSSFGNWMGIIIVTSDIITGKFYANELFVPRRPMFGISHYYQFGRWVKMAVDFTEDGSIHVYGRSSIAMNEIIITNFESLYPNITLKHINLKTNQTSTLNTRGYQYDFGQHMSNIVFDHNNITIRDILTIDPLDIFKEYLISVEQRPEIVNQVIKIQEQLFIEYNDLLVQYARGLTSKQSVMQLFEYKRKISWAQMRSLMGNEKTSLMFNRMLANPILTMHYEELLKQ